MYNMLEEDKWKDNNERKIFNVLNIWSLILEFECIL